jgi:hypothetical protein
MALENVEWIFISEHPTPQGTNQMTTRRFLPKGRL